MPKKPARRKKRPGTRSSLPTRKPAHPELAAELLRRLKGELPADFAEGGTRKKFIEKLQANPAKIASRKASQNAIEAFGPLLPEFLGGSADLAAIQPDPVVWL